MTRSPLARSTKSLPRHLASLALALLFGALGAASLDSGGSKRSAGAAKRSPKEEALAAVRLEYDWRKTAFDTIMEADFTITNPGPHPVKDVEVTCTHFAASGTQIDRNVRTLYEAVPAGGKKTVRGFQMGFIHSQAQSSSCTITDLAIGQ